MMKTLHVSTYVSDDDAQKSLDEFSVNMWMNFKELETFTFYLERVLENHRPMEFQFAEFLVDAIREFRKAKKEIRSRWTEERKKIKAKK